MNLLAALRVFERVSLLGSLSAAARDLGLSTTTASRLIADLEAELGVRLINRTTRRLSLTEAGREVAIRARATLDDIEEMRDAALGLHGETRGLIRVSCSNVLGHSRITRLIPKFLAAHPHVTIEYDLTSRYTVGVVEERYDVAIRFGEQTDSALIARHLGDVRNHVCATPAYFAAHGRPRHPDDLRAHNCVLTMYARRLGYWPFRGPHGDIDAPVRGRAATNTIEAVFQMTLAGFGIGNLPGLLVDEALADGRLEAVLDAYGPVTSPVYALMPHRTYVAARVRVFIDFLARELGPDLARRPG